MTGADAGLAAPELAALADCLDVQRRAILEKAGGLDQEQLARRLPPSTMTLAGLVLHLVLVEEDWMEVRFAGGSPREEWDGVDWDGDPDYEWRTAADWEPAALLDRYRLACERSRAVVAAAGGLDQLSAVPLEEGHFSLRWVLLHLIEETARHAGHADLIRESIDGLTGARQLGDP